MNTGTKQPPVCRDCAHYRGPDPWTHECHREAYERRNPITGSKETIDLRNCEIDRHAMIHPKDGCRPEGRFFTARPTPGVTAKPSAPLRLGRWIAGLFTPPPAPPAR